VNQKNKVILYGKLVKKNLAALAVCCSIVSQSFALVTDAKVNLLKDSLKKDSISFNTAYLNGQYTNKQLANFNVEFLNATDRIFDRILNRMPQDSEITGITGITVITSFVAFFWCNHKFATALHESGHGLRSKSYGMDYELMLDASKNSTFDYDLLIDNNYSFKKDENFFKYFIRDLFNQKINACRPDSAQLTNLKTMDNNSFCNGVIIFFAGGMNNNIQLAEKISDNIYSKKKKPGWLSYCMYLENRLNPIGYDELVQKRGYDPSEVRYWFKRRGENNFKKGAIRDAGYISLLLSATTYSMLTDKPLQFDGFRIPDVFPYITTRGMSYKVVSGYEIRNDLNLIFGFESALKIEPATECSLGISQVTIIGNKLPVSYRGIATFGQGLDFEASCSVPLSKDFSLSIGCEIYSVKSLQGQRNATTNMKKDNGSSSNFFASVSYRY
jgi:hypothetical protein